MYTVILALHIFICFLLIISVLLQNGKGSDIGSALGGGVSGEMFGPKAPSNIMNKITTVIAACFIVLSLTLAVMSGSGPNSIMKNSSNVPALDNTVPAVSDNAAPAVKENSSEKLR